MNNPTIARSLSPGNDYLLLPNAASMRMLYALVLLLALANVINVLTGKHLWPITRHIDLGSDTNMAAWFSSILLALGGLAATQCGIKSKRELGQVWGFGLLTLLVFAMSCDEIARLHETVYGDFAKALGVTGLSFAKHAAWVWVGGPLIAFTFLFTVLAVRKQLARVPGTTGQLGLGLGMMFLGGVVLESSINFLD